MSLRIETESKYYCIEPEKLINQCEILGLKKIGHIIEDDEYFTDINSAFIKNRTCLRIRKTDNSTMEITFKGKSLKLMGQYSKIENNIVADISNYEKYVSLFTSLGFYSYVNVDKERVIYNYSRKYYEYNVMIDKIKGIGGFVEFEIITNEDKYDKKIMQEELIKFVKVFNSVELTEANEPYRDIVANKIYKNSIAKKEKIIYLNIDSIVLELEKDFYKKYSTELKKIFNTKLKWNLYKQSDNKELKKLMEKYFLNRMLNTTEILALFKLLKKLDYDTKYVTKTNKMFYSCLLNRFGLDIDKYIYSDCEVSKSTLKNSIVLDGDIKNIIQKILIIINVG